LVKWHHREELVGKEIIDGEAKKIGAVKDLAWSNEGKLAIVVERGREEEYYLSFDQVEKIGDVVFAALEEKEKKSSARKEEKKEG
jgi:sporulation protein YlmC with PRC-barrel domain